MSHSTTDRRLQRIRAAIKARDLRIRAAIEARGLRIEPIGTAGAVRVRGPGVHVVAASLADLSHHDLTPALPQDTPQGTR